MLVLTRKKDEQIRIGDDIIITVIRVRGKSVRLGIQAPKTAPVLRAELEFREPRSAASESVADATDMTSATPSSESPAVRDICRRPLRQFLAANLAAR